MFSYEHALRHYPILMSIMASQGSAHDLWSAYETHIYGG